VLLLFLFGLTFVSLKRGQDFRAGVFLGLGLFKFPIVLPFALICLLRKKWRMMGGFVAAALALGALSVVAVGAAGIRSYGRLLLDIEKNPDNPIYISMRAWKQMPTFKGLLAAILNGRLATLQISLLATASLGFVIFTAWRWRQEDRGQSKTSLPLMFAAALTVSQLAAPHLYIYDLTLMLLPVILVIGSPQWSENSAQRKILLAIIAVLYAPPIFLLLLHWQALYLLAPALVAFALAAMSLAGKIETPST
jgi:hypothetical protein